MTLDFRTFFSVLALAAFLPILPLHAAPRNFVGVNTATWDPGLDTPKVEKLLSQARVTMLRFPGGSTSDSFDWTKPQGSSTAQFAHLAESIHALATITANYGSGSRQMVAAWVAYCNAAPSSRIDIGADTSGRDWKSAGYWASLRSAHPLIVDDGMNNLRADHPAPFGFKNWEIGNECYGSWENDQHQPKHDPVEYARFVIAAGNLMRRVDPTIRVGVVVTDDTHHYETQEWVLYGPSQQPVSEWTPVVLSALSKHGFQPDFVAFHHYAQDPGQESDAKLFADVTLWPGMVGTLKTQLSNFYGIAARKIGIACTEVNSVSFNPGPQTTGDANARYYAQIAPVAYRLGIETLIWWDLHNSENRSGYDTHSALNKFPFGDYGILRDWRDQPYPVYYSIAEFGDELSHSKASVLTKR